MNLGTSITSSQKHTVSSKGGVSEAKWNSIIDKTLLFPESNRQIGGEALNKYSRVL